MAYALFTQITSPEQKANQGEVNRKKHAKKSRKKPNNKQKSDGKKDRKKDGKKDSQRYKRIEEINKKERGKETET